MKQVLFFVVGIFLLLDASPAIPEAPKSSTTDWPRWRGPNADGVADGRNLPIRWSQTENVRWSAKLPGWGTSSPVVYANRVFITSHVKAEGTALFPTPVLDYSTAEDEMSMDAIYTAAAHICKTFPQHPVLIDGRTFLRSAQIHDLLALAASLEETPRIIECVCSDEVAKKRLDDDLASGQHPAKNRTFALYLAVKARAEAITIPHLVLDTGTMTLEECVQQSLRYLREAK